VADSNTTLSWLCAGCGNRSIDTKRRCNCVTDVLYRIDGGRMEHGLKADWLQRDVARAQARLKEWGVLPFKVEISLK
jgi:hypothetical protein